MIENRPIFRWWLPAAALAALVVAVWFRWAVLDPARVDLPAPLVDVHQGAIPHAEHRSGHWPKVRAVHLAQHPACEVCGETDHVEVHHFESFHLHPEKELDPTNLVTLCGHGSRWNHHLWYGHLGDYQCENASLREWVKAVKERKWK